MKERPVIKPPKLNWRNDKMESQFHIIDVTLVNGNVLRNLPVALDYNTNEEYEVVSDFLDSTVRFKYGSSWYPIDKVLSVAYRGIDERRHDKYERKYQNSSL